MTGIHKRTWPGNADRPALALHCMMGNASYWRPIAAALSDLVEITAPDMPGHGPGGDWDGGPPDFHTTVTRNAAALISRPVDLIGHSIGATVALRIAVAAPEAVRSLTLIEPVLFAAAPDAHTAAEMEEIAALTTRGDLEQAARRFLGTWGGLDWAEQTPTARQRLARQMQLVVSGNDTLMRDGANILRDGGLEAIDAPVMLVMGSQSPVVISAIADALAQRLQDVGRAVIPDAGHMLPITHPEQTSALVRMNLERA